MTKQLANKSREIKATCSRWIATCVDVFSHPALDRGPYDRRSAWLWMIANAAWHDKRINHKGKPLELKRGQLLIGRAFLAELWGWSDQNVRSFVHLLVSEKMIEINQSNGHNANVATICNYDTYQTGKEIYNQCSNQSLTSAQPEPNHTLTRDTKVTIEVNGVAREREESENDRICRQAYEREAETKGGKTAKSARSFQRAKGELDGSTGITLENGKLTLVNGSAAAILDEFPGIDLAAVSNKAAPELMRCNYPTHDQAMAVIRKWAQIAQEAKPARASTPGKPRTVAEALAAKYANAGGPQ